MRSLYFFRLKKTFKTGGKQGNNLINCTKSHSYRIIKAHAPVTAVAYPLLRK